MLGSSLRDLTAEGHTVPGLGLLPVRTEFHHDKRTVQVRGESLPGFAGVPGGLPLEGYEIHMGRTEREGGRPFARVAAADAARYEEGTIAEDGRAAGTYLHGLFDSDAYRGAWIEAARRHAGLASTAVPLRLAERHEAALDRLADVLAAHLDLDAIDRLLAPAGDP